LAGVDNEAETHSLFGSCFNLHF